MITSYEILIMGVMLCYSVNSLYWSVLLVRCDGRIAICADTATPIYRYIEFKGQFQVRTAYEMAIMGVMLCLGFAKIGDFSRILDA